MMDCSTVQSRKDFSSFKRKISDRSPSPPVERLNFPTVESQQALSASYLAKGAKLLAGLQDGSYIVFKLASSRFSFYELRSMAVEPLATVMPDGKLMREGATDDVYSDILAQVNQTNS
jgi:hypothetical protein